MKHARLTPALAQSFLIPSASDRVCMFLNGAQLTTQITAAIMAGKPETEGGTSQAKSTHYFNVS